MTLNPKIHVPSTTAPAPRRRGTWSSAVRGVAAAGGALAVALLATACTQASAAVLEEPSAVPSVAADAASEPSDAAAQKPAEAAAPEPEEAAPAPSDEGEPSPVPAAPSESPRTDQSAPSPAPAAPSETGPTDQRDPRPVPSVPGEPEQGLVVTG